MQSDSVTTTSVAPETIQAVERLLDELRHAGPDGRRTARKQLNAMGFDAAPAIREICRPTLRDRIYELCAESDFPYWLLVAISAAMIPPLHQFRAAGLFVLLGAAAAVLYARWRIGRSALREVRARKLEGLRYVLKLNDKRIVPILLDLQELVTNRPDDLDFLPALNRLLPTLEEQDSFILSPRHRAGLNRVLLGSVGGAADVDHRIAVLKALLRVGDTSFIPAVRRLAYARADSHFRETACCCLEHLERRGAVPGQILLRPLPASTEPDALLRSVGGNPDSGEEGLLRPVAAPSAETGEAVEG